VADTAGGVAVPVPVAVAVPVRVGVPVRVPVAVAVPVRVRVAVEVALGNGVWVGVQVGASPLQAAGRVLSQSGQPAPLPMASDPVVG
jgi:hypothetical protein